MEFEYYKLLPETPGQLGEKTILNNTIRPPKVESLHFVFDGWLGDELIECFPCYLVTESLSYSLGSANLTGFKIIQVDISFSRLFLDLYPNREMPGFKWLEINGRIGDDFYIDEKNYLVASNKALKVIQNSGNLKYCEIERITI
jgi:hypothetical protein